MKTTPSSSVTVSAFFLYMGCLLWTCGRIDRQSASKAFSLAKWRIWQWPVSTDYCLFTETRARSVWYLSMFIISVTYFSL